MIILCYVIYVQRKGAWEWTSSGLEETNWAQETCLLIQAAVVDNFEFFHRGLHECFDKEYEHLFDVPQHSRTDNDVLGLSPIYTRAAGWQCDFVRIVAGDAFISNIVIKIYMYV